MVQDSTCACELCGRTDVVLTEHHLIPRKLHRNKRVRQQYGRETLRTRVAMLCRPCHNTVHAEIDEKTLGREYSTIELLRSHPGVKAFAEWIADKPGDTTVPVRKPRR